MASSVINELLFEGIFIGAVLLSILYSLSLYISFKDKSYLYLIVFYLTSGISLLLISSYGFYDTSTIPAKMQYILPILIFTALASSIEFSRLYLRSDSFNLFWHVVLIWERNLFIAGIFFSFIIPNILLPKIIAASTLLGISSIMITGFLSIKTGRRRASIIVIIWGLLFIGVAVFILKLSGVFPESQITNLSIQVGFLLLIILTPVSVPFRVKEEGKEKDSVRRKLSELQKFSEQVSSVKVEEETGEIDRINIMLMDRAIELGSINQLSERINSSLDMDDVLQSACEELVKIFPVAGAGIALLDAEKEKLVIEAFQKGTSVVNGLIGKEIILKNNEPFLDVVDSNNYALIENMSENYFEKNVSEIELFNISHSLLIVPISSMREVIGAIFLPVAESDYKFGKNEINLAKTVALQVAGSVKNARLYAQTEKALGTAVNDLEIGRQIQADFFPGILGEIKGWEFYPYFKAARQVSGDFYDAFKINDSGYTAFVVGDVCDKGVGAALFMVLFRSLLRAYSLKEKRIIDIKSFLEYIITSTNNYIAETHNRANMFAAVFYGILDPENNEIHYINGGLEAPVILNSEGTVIDKLIPTGPVVGMFPDMKFKVNSVRLNPGDIFFAYTDGTVDAKNNSQELFGEEALLKAISLPWSSGFSMLFNLNSLISRHIGSRNQYDDITQITLRRKLSAGDYRHSIIRKAKIYNLGELRDFVEKAVIHCGLNKDFVFAFKLASEEISTNIIKYGYEGEETGDIKIEFQLEPDTAVLKIYDFGKRYKPDEKDSANTDEDWEKRKIGGLGITLVKGFMDTVEYINGPDKSNCVVLRKKLK